MSEKMLVVSYATIYADFKDVFGSFFYFWIDFFYVAGNVMLNKANKNNRSPCSFFFLRKMMLITPTLVNNFDKILIFPYSH